MPQRRRLREINAARIGDRRNAHRAIVDRKPCKLLEPRDTGLAEAFAVRHDVGLGDGHEIFGAEKIANLHLVLQCLLAGGTHFSGQHASFFVSEVHGETFLAGTLTRARQQRAGQSARAPTYPLFHATTFFTAHRDRAGRRRGRL